MRLYNKLLRSLYLANLQGGMDFGIEFGLCTLHNAIARFFLGYYKVKFSVSLALPAQPAREFKRLPNTAQYCPIEFERMQTTAQLRASQAKRG